jgi:hypothetical protein
MLSKKIMNGASAVLLMMLTTWAEDEPWYKNGTEYQQYTQNPKAFIEEKSTAVIDCQFDVSDWPIEQFKKISEQYDPDSINWNEYLKSPCGDTNGDGLQINEVTMPLEGMYTLYPYTRGQLIGVEVTTEAHVLSAIGASAEITDIAIAPKIVPTSKIINLNYPSDLTQEPGKQATGVEISENGFKDLQWHMKNFMWAMIFWYDAIDDINAEIESTFSESFNPEEVENNFTQILQLNEEAGDKLNAQYALLQRNFDTISELNRQLADITRFDGYNFKESAPPILQPPLITP